MVKLIYELEAENQTAPMVVFVHGRGGHLKVMKPFLRAIPQGYSKLFVQAPYGDPDIGGYSWWLVNKEPPNLSSGDTLVEAVCDLCEEHHLDPSCFLGLGFSQGGGVLSLAVQRSPSVFQGIALLASFALKHPEPKGTLSGVKVLQIHGEKDNVITVAHAKESMLILKNAGAPIEEFIESDIQHKIGTAGMKRLSKWVNSFTESK